MKYLKCKKCGKVDKTDKSVTPHHIGTSIEMICPDCAESLLNPLATLCRNCCITQHGTKG